jgi:hypothetical protein
MQNGRKYTQNEACGLNIRVLWEVEIKFSEKEGAGFFGRYAV